MKLIQTTGLILFLLGFAIFIGSFFLSDFRIANEQLDEVLTASERETLEPHLQHMANQEYGSNFTFIHDLNRAFVGANEYVMDTYGLSNADLEAIAAASGTSYPIHFSLDVLDQVFSSEEEVDILKKKAFLDYGGWLDQREYQYREVLLRDLGSVAENFNKYGIIGLEGFDKYRVKNLKYELARSSSTGPVKDRPWLFLGLTYVLCILGAIMYLLPKVKNDGPPGIRNNNIHFSSMKNRGWLGIITGTFLIVFYITLYYFPEYMTNWIIMVDPVSNLLNGSPAGRFFLYGFLYTLTILVMGIRMLINYRHSNYQIARTISVMFFQTAFAFLIPEILVRLNKPYFDFKNIWPLDYDFFFDNELSTLIDSGSLGIFMLGWGIALIVLGVPILVYFFGKRWYCSWVCGCGGLAETLGDSYRQLSDKSLKAWKVERWMVHAVLVFAVVMTGGVLYTYWTGSSQILGLNTYTIREAYGAWIGAGFAGVVGTGFYPLMGNRVWCRFGCPLAAYLGIVQRFKSRFRITTNGGQCISCGNCSTYCEMGIDVRWYAQRGQNIVRSSCVGCGICSAVCPRGVLNLENTSEKSRFNEPVLIGNDSFEVRE
jgi:polyferredoxin